MQQPFSPVMDEQTRQRMIREELRRTGQIPQGNAPLNTVQQLKIDDVQNQRSLGSDMIAKSDSPNAWTALAKTLASGLSSKWDRDRGAERGSVLEKSMQREANVGRRQQNIENTMTERKQSYLEGAPDRAAKILAEGRSYDESMEVPSMRTTYDGSQRVQEEFDPVSRQWNEVGRGEVGAGTVVNLGAGDNAYTKKRQEQNAERMGTYRKSADASIRSQRNLKQFMRASAEGREGGAVPIVSGIQNFLVTFGFSDTGLKDVAGMQQAIGSIKKEHMDELGARGLTDKDMEIISEALPRAETSREAREAVAGVLQKANDYKIREYIDLIESEKGNYPDIKQMLPSWYDDEKRRYDAYNILKQRGKVP